VFHNLDGNGRVPRGAFFAKLSTSAFEGVKPGEIAAHFREFAWQKPLLFDGVIEFLQELKADGYAIGIVSNGGSHSQNSKLKNSGLASFVDSVVISEEFGAKKPDSSIYREIAAQLHIDIGSSWFIGDDPISDVIGPSRVGFITAWVERYLPWPEDQPRRYRRQIAHISDLREDLLGDG
jgi:putative hydrolase of the HAD superfamily